MSKNARSHGLWDETAPAAPVTAPLNGDIVTDIAVVGAGFTGLCAALHLAQAGRGVAILDADEIGHGGSGRNVGLINAGMWVMPDDLPGALGAVYGERLLELLGAGPQTVMALIDRHEIECELERNGTLHCAVGEAGLAEIHERARQWRKRGAPIEVLTAEETAARTGSSAYAGALWDRRAGTLQPLAYARGLARAAIANGAVIHTASRVTACRRQGGAWRLSTGSGGSLTAQWVVAATDAYSVGPWRSVRREQTYLPYFNLATPPLPPDIRATILPGKEGAWDTRKILSSFRMDKAGRLVFGSVGALRNAGRAVHVSWAKRALSRLFAQLAHIDFDHEWYGWIGMTGDALPRFHYFDEKIIGFSGYNGRGIAPGTVFGALLARLILGELTQADLPLPVSALSAPVLRPVKEIYYEFGAQIAHFAKDRG